MEVMGIDQVHRYTPFEFINISFRAPKGPWVTFRMWVVNSMNLVGFPNDPLGPFDQPPNRKLPDGVRSEASAHGLAQKGVAAEQGGSRSSSWSRRPFLCFSIYIYIHVYNIYIYTYQQH